MTASLSSCESKNAPIKSRTCSIRDGFCSKICQTSGAASVNRLALNSALAYRSRNSGEVFSAFASGSSTNIAAPTCWSAIRHLAYPIAIVSSVASSAYARSSHWFGLPPAASACCASFRKDAAAALPSPNSEESSPKRTKFRSEASSATIRFITASALGARDCLVNSSNALS